MLPILLSRSICGGGCSLWNGMESISLTAKQRQTENRKVPAMQTAYRKVENSNRSNNINCKYYNKTAVRPRKVHENHLNQIICFDIIPISLRFCYLNFCYNLVAADGGLFSKQYLLICIRHVVCGVQNILQYLFCSLIIISLSLHFLAFIFPCIQKFMLILHFPFFSSFFCGHCNFFAHIQLSPKRTKSTQKYCRHQEVVQQFCDVLYRHLLRNQFEWYLGFKNPLSSFIHRYKEVNNIKCIKYIYKYVCSEFYTTHFTLSSAFLPAI